jgi:enamine deaminase RidA (YjgF/YER057c/UK114 family)
MCNAVSADQLNTEQRQMAQELADPMAEGEEMATRSGAGMEKIDQHGLSGCVLRRAECSDIYVTGTLEDGMTPRSLYERVARFVQKRGGTAVRATVFGLPDEPGSGRREFALALGEDCPVMWLDEGSHNEPPIGGMELHAVTGPMVERVRLRDRVVGSVYSDGDARYCCLAGLRPDRTELPRSDQAQIVFDDIEAALEAANMTFDDVVRTWFWNHEILDWYDEFNAVRTHFFEENGVFDKMVPASTGIGAHNAAGAALEVGLVACQALKDGVSSFPVVSPLQCPAPEYGSSFSRAAEIETPQYRILYVSGTASIHPGGETAFEGDLEKQLDLTFDVVQAILESRDMGWQDASRAIAYFRRAEDVEAFDAFLRRRGIEGLPCLVTNATVCRDDLLFELEVDTLVQK